MSGVRDIGVLNECVKRCRGCELISQWPEHHYKLKKYASGYVRDVNLQDSSLKHSTAFT